MRLPRLSDDTFIAIDRVTFGYDERVILSDVSLRFARGSVTAILGASGCGKTTLLRLIGGTVKPQSGRILFDGEPVNPDDRTALYRLRRRIGMLFQFGALFTDMTLFDNVAFPLREHTRLPESMIRDIVTMKLHAVGLRGAAHLKPAEVSGGMARRVALARTIALDPELIMYDEPFTGLDPISLGVAANLIRRLNDATGATSLMRRSVQAWLYGESRYSSRMSAFASNASTLTFALRLMCARALPTATVCSPPRTTTA